MIRYTNKQWETRKEALKEELRNSEEYDPALVQEIEIIQSILDTRRADAYAKAQEK